jgi:hypothetical protein
MNLRTTANPAKPIDISNAELPASGAVTGGPTFANELSVTITKASIARPRHNFDFCILFFAVSLCFNPFFHYFSFRQTASSSFRAILKILV